MGTNVVSVEIVGILPIEIPEVELKETLRKIFKKIVQLVDHYSIIRGNKISKSSLRSLENELKTMVKYLFRSRVGIGNESKDRNKECENIQ